MQRLAWMQIRIKHCNLQSFGHFGLWSIHITVIGLAGEHCLCSINTDTGHSVFKAVLIQQSASPPALCFDGSLKMQNVSLVLPTHTPVNIHKHKCACHAVSEATHSTLSRYFITMEVSKGRWDCLTPRTLVWVLNRLNGFQDYFGSLPQQTLVRSGFHWPLTIHNALRFKWLEVFTYPLVHIWLT